jgi:hypothetical protein
MAMAVWLGNGQAATSLSALHTPLRRLYLNDARQGRRRFGFDVLTASSTATMEEL